MRPGDRQAIKPVDEGEALADLLEDRGACVGATEVLEMGEQALASDAEGAGLGGGLEDSEGGVFGGVG